MTIVVVRRSPFGCVEYSNVASISYQLVNGVYCYVFTVDSVQKSYPVDNYTIMILNKEG